MSQSAHEAARAACVTDWRAGGDHDNLTKWVEGALRAHSLLTTKQRTKKTPKQPVKLNREAPEPGGSTPN